MKRATEGEFGAALRGIENVRIHVYRPPDPKTGAGVSNWKPCDYMVWRRVGPESIDLPSDRYFNGFALSAWFEVKDVDDVKGYPFGDLRPSQAQGIYDAAAMGIPYWLAIWWRRHKEWSISNAAAVLAWRKINTSATSIPRELLISRFGISTSKAQLSSTLKGVLLGEVD